MIGHKPTEYIPEKLDNILNHILSIHIILIAASGLSTLFFYKNETPFNEIYFKIMSAPFIGFCIAILLLCILAMIDIEEERDE